MFELKAARRGSSRPELPVRPRSSTRRTWPFGRPIPLAGGVFQKSASPDRAAAPPDKRLSMDPCFLPATRLAAMIAARAISPVEVMEAVLARAERLDPLLNPFALRLFDAARAAARAAEA